MRLNNGALSSMQKQTQKRLNFVSKLFHEQFPLKRGVEVLCKKKTVLTVYIQKWANAGRCWAADQHLLRSYKRFECNRDLKLSEVRCLEYHRSFTTHREFFTSSSRSRRQFLAQHPPHGLVVASPSSVTRHAFPLTRLN